MGHEGQQQGTVDAVVAELQALRAAAGDPSYGEIARNVARTRVTRGMTTEAARVGRTTVYDAFRTGRARLDPRLVSDLALALGTSEQDAEALRKRATDAARSSATAPSERSAPPPTPADPARSEPTVTPAGTRPRPGRRAALTLCALAVGLNLIDRIMVGAAHLPLYLDMVGTAIAAIVCGPWYGAAVGTTTSFAGVAVSGWNSAPFAITEIVGALTWGYGVRRFGLGRTIPRFFLLNVMVALASTLVSVPIIVFVFDGTTGNAADQVTSTIDALLNNLVLAVGAQNVLTSLADKLISGFVALTAASAAPSASAYVPDSAGPLLHRLRDRPPRASALRPDLP